MAEPKSTWEVISNLGREQTELLQQLRDELSATKAALAAETASRRLEAEELRTQLQNASREAAANLEEALEAERSTRATLGRRLTELARDLAEERAARAHDSRRLADLECATFGVDGVLMKKNGEIMHYPAAMHVPPPRGPQPYEYAAPPPPPPPPPPPRGPPPPRNRTPDIAPDQAWSQEAGTPNSTRIRSKSWQDLDNGGRKHKQRPQRTTSPSQGDDQQQSARPVAPPTAEQLRQLEDQILVLCDDAPNGSILCANLPRLYYYKFRKTLEFRQLGFIKMSQLLTKMERVHYDGKHRAEISRKQPNQTSVQNRNSQDALQPAHHESTSPQDEGHGEPDDDDDDATRDDHQVTANDEQVAASNGQADGNSEDALTNDEHESTTDECGGATKKQADTNNNRVGEHVEANDKHIEANGKQVEANGKHVEANDKHVDANEKHVDTDDKHVDANDEHGDMDDKHVDTDVKHVDTDDTRVNANDKHVDLDQNYVDANNKHTDANNDAQDDGDGFTETKSYVANDEEEQGAESSSATTEVIALVTPPAEQQQQVSSKADFDDEGEPSTLAHVERTADDDEPALPAGKQDVAVFDKNEATVEQSADPQSASREDASPKPPDMTRGPSWSAVVAGGAKARQIPGVATRRPNGAPAPPR